MYSIWQEVVFVRLLVPFIAGIVGAIFMDLPSLYWGIAFAVLAVIFYIHHRNQTFHLHYYNLRWLTGFLLSLAFIALGGCLTEYHKSIQYESHFGNQEDHAYAKVKLTYPPVSKPRSVQARVEVQQLIDSAGNSQPVTGKALLYLSQNEATQELFYGDVLLIKNRLQKIPPPQNPGEFDYQEYMSFQQIHHRTFLDSTDWKLHQKGQGNGFFHNVYKLRHYLLAVLETHIEDDESLAVASALLLGYRERLGNEVKLAYSSAGAMHVLAVSGLHVGIIYLILRWLLAPLYGSKRWEALAVVLSITAIWLYATLTGFAPSVLRASTMFSLIIIGTTLRRDTNIYNILAASAFFLLCIDPFLIMEVGFQLSYCAVVGIVFLQPKIYNLFTIQNWLGDKIWAITAVSFAAQLATFPISLLYFHQFPTLFPISNLIVIPSAFVILHVGLGLFALHWVEMIGKGIGWLLSTIIGWLNKAIFFIDNLPYSLIQGISISVPESWLIYIFTFATIFFLVYQRWLYLKVALVAALLLVSWNNYESWQQMNQKALTVYKVDHTSAIELRDGRQALFMADSSLLHNESKLLFHVKHNWWNANLKSIIKVSGNQDVPKDLVIDQQGSFYQIGNKRIGILERPLPSQKPAKPLSLDYLIIKDNPDLNIDHVAQWFEVDQLIIDSSHPKWRAEKWQQEANRLALDCYPVPLKDAFVTKL